MRDWYFKKYQPGNDNETTYASFEQDATDNLRNVLGQLGIDPDTLSEDLSTPSLLIFTIPRVLTGLSSSLSSGSML